MLSDAEVNKLLEDVSVDVALAASRYTEAWEPAGGGHHDKDLEGSFTYAAADRRREIEMAVREAKTREDREAARRDMGTYRV